MSEGVEKMNEKELLKRLQEEAQETVEFASYQQASEKLIEFLAAYVPEEQHKYMGVLLQIYSQKSVEISDRMKELAEELMDAK